MGIIRSFCVFCFPSPELVEAAFDGDMASVRDWLEKGYDLESEDPHGHTALSDAAAQVRCAVDNECFDDSLCFSRW